MKPDQPKSPDAQDASPTDETVPSAPSSLEPGDFYYEGAYLVFTEAYHIKRGFCCNSDCRHCPYR